MLPALHIRNELCYPILERLAQPRCVKGSERTGGNGVSVAIDIVIAIAICGGIRGLETLVDLPVGLDAEERSVGL
tara:strand:+ start:17214 stop:17438 length:225 start_codon:yes stop_codon:yes gene_type:complete